MVRAEGAEVCNIVLIMELKRIQRKRVKGWKMPENTVYVGRPTKWGNPFRVEEDSAGVFAVVSDDDFVLYSSFNKKDCLNVCLENYKEHISHEHNLGIINIENLKGKNLACFCKEGEPCHADILLKLANI